MSATNSVHETNHLDPFAFARRNGETATAEATIRTGDRSDDEVGMAPPAGIAPVALPPMERLMPDTHVIPLVTRVLGDREEGDSQVLALFKRWLDEVDAFSRASADDEEKFPFPWEIEKEIAHTSGGPIALSVKAFFGIRYAKWNDRKRVPWSTSDAVLRYPQNGEPEILDDFMLSILRDAAKVAPILSDLVAPLVHEDAVLIDADMEIGVCREWFAEFGEGKDRPGRRQEVMESLSAAVHCIATTEAETAKGAEIKRRHAEAALVAPNASSTRTPEDPVLALIAERERLEEETNATNDEEIGEEAYTALVNKTALKIIHIDEEIAGFVAKTQTSLIAQVRHLQYLAGSSCKPFGIDNPQYSEDCLDRLVASVSAGIERLAGGAV
jgi:hypothetical protein